MDAPPQLSQSLADRYAIDRLVGEGGMARVYLARDVRHDRPVALKVLNPELGAVLGVERFLSEIRVTANLQHPNLLPLFDSGEAGGLLFYVMPYVEGESLRARLHREKQLPIDDAIRMTIAIADALDYAHSHGVIHRDLKPENILLQHGQPVVADFGIALAVTKAGGNRITQTGLSLGTPQYMSPEQATGDRVIDGRSDVYSLAAMLYEMLTGEPPHIGNTSQAIIARVLTDTPRPVRGMRPSVPEHVERAVACALEKLPADRFATAREFAEALSGKSTTATSSGIAQTMARPAVGWKTRLRDPLVAALAVIAIAATGGFVASVRLPAPAPLSPIRFVISTPDSFPTVDGVPWPGAISPNGQWIAYSALAPSAFGSIWLLRTDQIHGRPIPNANDAGQAVFSPDGQWLLYEGRGKEWKMRLDGSSPIAIGDGASFNGADWTVNDEIVNGATGAFHGLSIYSASGGERTRLTAPDSSAGELEHVWPIAFPSGKHVAFAIWKGSLPTSQLAIASIPDGEVKRLGIRGIRPLAVLDGMLVYVQADGSVMAVAVNERQAKLTGKPIPVHDRVSVVQGLNGNSRIFVSSAGGLITSVGSTLSRIALLDRSGVTRNLTRQPAGFFGPRLSPDGTRIAVVSGDGTLSDLWIQDIATGTLSRLTTTGSVTSTEWLNNRELIFTAVADSLRTAVWQQDANGASPPRMLYQASEALISASIARDGSSLALQVWTGVSWDIVRVALNATPVRAQRLLASESQEVLPRLSPDGRWLSYMSDETGRAEVYVRSYPDPATKVQISNGGGSNQAWSPDGTSLYYSLGDRIFEARLSTTPTLRVVARDTAFRIESQSTGFNGGTGFEPTRDRNRILVVKLESNKYQVIASPNWLGEFRTRVKAR